MFSIWLHTYFTCSGLPNRCRHIGLQNFTWLRIGNLQEVHFHNWIVRVCLLFPYNPLVHNFSLELNQCLKKNASFGAKFLQWLLMLNSINKNPILRLRCSSNCSKGWVNLIRMVVNSTSSSLLFSASVGPASGVILASYAGCDQILVVTLFTVGMAFMGFFYPSLKVNALDLSPNYAGTLMAIVNGIGAISGIISPYLIGILVPNVS